MSIAEQLGIGLDLRPITAAVTSTIPPLSGNDIELVVSTGGDLAAGAPPTGQLVLVDTELVHVAIRSDRYGQLAFAGRYGDAFALSVYDTENASNPPPSVSPNSLGGLNVVKLDEIILGHSVSAPESTASPTEDLFHALHVDAAALTAAWDDGQTPLDPETTEHRMASDSAPYKMVALDGSRVAVAGTAGQAGGWQGTLYMVEYDNGTGVMTGYGPFDYGALAAEGGNHPTGETILVRLDASRLAVLWFDKEETDNSGTTDLAIRRPLHAQLFEYDVVAHDFTALGPHRVFESGLTGENQIHVKWYEDAGVLVLVSLNYARTGNIGASSVVASSLDYHVGARSLLIEADDILEGTSSYRVANMGSRPNADGYFYSCQVVGAGDRLAVIWPDVGDDGGDIRYTKLRVGLTGEERGGLASYDHGVLIPDVGFNYEMWAHGHQAALDAASSVALFEQYVDSYNRVALRFVLAREA